MGGPVMRGGTWWHQQPDGSWLTWDNASQNWQPAAGQPPPPGPYDQPPPGSSPYGPTYGGGQLAQAGSPPGRTLTIISFVLAAIAVIFFPIILGPAAIILAAIAMSKGDPLGRWALITAIACTVAGFVIGYLVFQAANN